jgi:hypothetical protein
MAKKRFFTASGVNFHNSIAPRDIDYVENGNEQVINAYFNEIGDPYTPIDNTLNENSNVYIFANFVDVIDPQGEEPAIVEITPDELKSGENWKLLEKTNFPLEKINDVLVPKYIITLNVTKYNGNFQIAFYSSN